MKLYTRYALVSAVGFGLGGCLLSGENRPPVIEAESPSPAVGDEDGTLSFGLHAYDLDGDFLDIVGISSAGFQDVSRTLVDGVSHLEAGIWITPRPDYNGTGSVSLSVSDGEAITDQVLYYRIEPVNDPPVARDDFYAVPVNAPLVLSAPSLLVNDDDATDLYAECSPDQCVSMPPPAYGLAVVRADEATGGTVTLVDGTLRFVPAPDFVGTALFDYTITDGAATAGASVHVMVGGPNTPPTAAADDVTLFESARDIYQSLLVSNDLDLDGHALAVIGVGSPMGGSVALSDGVVTVAPDADEMSFDYTVTDGASTSIARVTVRIAYWL